MTENNRVILPSTVIPSNYEITLTPNLEDFTFKGHVVIKAITKSQTSEVVLNAAELEVEKSIAIALKILRDIPTVNIELHLDVSPSEKKEKSSKFADMLIGYARGVGFECKVKPEAFAATSIADKHTR